LAQPTEHWKPDPEEHDFPAAADYLELLLPGEEVARLVAALKQAATVHKKAKDLARASRLSLLPADNRHVAKDLQKVKEGARLSPVLLVRGQLGANVALTIADGYHRICASYLLDENAAIPCRIVDSPRG
jgi:hypothetical protein